jgi:hypothetical protein
MGKTIITKRVRKIDFCKVCGRPFTRRGGVTKFNVTKEEATAAKLADRFKKSRTCSGVCAADNLRAAFFRVLDIDPFAD